MSDNEQKGDLQTVLPPYDIDKSPFSWEKLDGLLFFKCSLVMCGELLGVHESTVKAHIKKRYDQTFSEYANKKLSRTRVKLVQKAIEMATAGNVTMLIFCLKNICHWQDKTEQSITNEIPSIEFIKDDRD